MFVVEKLPVTTANWSGAYSVIPVVDVALVNVRRWVADWVVVLRVQSSGLSSG